MQGKNRKVCQVQIMGGSVDILETSRTRLDPSRPHALR